MKEMIEVSVAIVIGLGALWFMGAKPKEPGRRGLISRVLK